MLYDDNRVKSMLLFVWPCSISLCIYLGQWKIYLNPVCILNLYCYLPILATALDSIVSLSSPSEYLLRV